MRDTTAAGLEATIREYFDACNAADAQAIAACFEPDGVHYFPAGAPQGTFVGAKAIAAGWVTAVENRCGPSTGSSSMLRSSRP
jgi:ketosteroid isomerase-like protein